MLRTAIWCALTQEGVDTSVIVVDDGPGEETSGRLANLEHAGIALLRTDKSRGVSTARNLGLEYVRTEWVAFLDDDDVWAPFHLAKLLEAIAEAEQSGGRIALAYSGNVAINRDRTVKLLRPSPPPEEVPKALLSTNAVGMPARVLLRTEAVRAAGGFDPDLAMVADWDLWLRVVRDGAVARSASLSVGYTVHEENMHRAAHNTLKELPVLEERYGHERDDDRSFLDSCSRWVATSYRAAGRARPAARWYLRTFRVERQPRDLGRAIGVLLGERAVRASGLKRTVEYPPEIAPWLEGIRRIDRLPHDDVPFGR